MKNPITIYDRYIFKQVLFTTIVAILLFTVVWIAPEMLLNTIKHVLEGQYTPKAGVLILIFEIPQILGKALPVGLLLGTLFTFDKLSKDSELTIFRAVGMSFFRIIAPVLVLSVLVSGMCFYTFDRMIPYSCQRLIELKDKKFLTQFIYSQRDKNGNPSQAVVVSKFGKGKMEGVIVMDFADTIYDDLHGLENVLVAETGRKGVTADGNPCWILNDITSYDISEDGIFHEVKKLDTINILEGEAANNAYAIMENSTKRDRDLNNQELKSYITLLKKENLDEEYRLMQNKYYQRFVNPLVCILLAILGCLLGFSKPREQKLIGFTIAIGCIFGYYITLPFFDLMAEKGVLNPLLAAIVPIIAFASAIVAFYKTRDI